MKRSHVILSITVVVMMAFLAGYDASTTSPPPNAAPSTATQPPTIQETTLPTEQSPTVNASTSETSTMPTELSAGDALTWKADGVIGDGEYTDTANLGKVRLWWRHDGKYLYFAMEGDTQGWVSIGIEPSRAMKDADYFFGFVLNGEAKLWDAFGVGVAGPNHPADDEIGGANHIIEFAGIETGGVTRFELKRLLDTGDPYDKALTPGNTYHIIVATGDADDYNSYHAFVRKGKMTLQP